MSRLFSMKFICLCMVLCTLFALCGSAFAASVERTVTVSFSDEDAAAVFFAAKGSAVFTDSFRSQMTAFELRVYKRLEESIDFMRKNEGDLIEIDLSGQPTAHHGNSGEISQIAIPLFTAVYAFEFDHPELFWFSKLHAYSYSYNSSNNVIVKFYIKAGGANGWRSDVFPTYQSLVDGEKAFNDSVNSILAGAKGKGTFETVKYFNKYIIDNCTYNPKVDAGQTYETLGEMPWSAYSAIVKQTSSAKYPVCEGYAKAFKVLCDKSGIPCVLVVGTYKGNDHMWNIVRMVNGLWFYEDATFNDVDKQETKFFLRGESMAKNHKANSQLSGSSRAIVYPVLSKYDYTQAVGDSLGDANGDGKINTTDAATILRHAAGVQEITNAFRKNCADFNCDDKVNTADAAAILRYCAGM